MTTSGQRYLLIVGCSQRKRPDPGLLPAIERYDGVNFRVLRKARREGYWPDCLDVLILSARYGLLEPERLIEDYDQPMTRERATEMESMVAHGIDWRIVSGRYREVFVNLGRLYRLALQESQEVSRLQGRVFFAAGGIGERMSQMRRWLLSVSGREARC